MLALSCCRAVQTSCHDGKNSCAGVSMWLSGFWIKTEGKATLFLEISCFFSGLPSAPVVVVGSRKACQISSWLMLVWESQTNKSLKESLTDQAMQKVGPFFCSFTYRTHRVTPCWPSVESAPRKNSIAVLRSLENAASCAQQSIVPSEKLLSLQNFNDKA